MTSSADHLIPGVLKQANCKTLLGLAGRKRCGKDTAGAYLCDLLVGETYAYGDGVKRAAMAIYMISEELAFTEDDHKKDHYVIEPWGMTVRQMLQTVGTEMVRGHDPEHWVKRSHAAMAAADCLVITDVRFDNEAQDIRDQGGIVVQLERPRPKPRLLARMGAFVRWTPPVSETDGHASEAGVSPHLIDHTIHNDGDVEDLFRKANCLMADIGYIEE